MDERLNLTVVNKTLINTWPSNLTLIHMYLSTGKPFIQWIALSNVQTTGTEIKGPTLSVELGFWIPIVGRIPDS